MRLAGLAWLLVAAVGLGGCRGGELPERILLIGADGLECSVALPLVHGSRLPLLISGNHSRWEPGVFGAAGPGIRRLDAPFE